jgi:cation transport regulator ChaC
MKRAKAMINCAGSLALSRSSLVVGTMIAAKNGQLQEAANYWHKGKSALQKSGVHDAWTSDTALLQLDKFMSKSKQNN